MNHKKLTALLLLLMAAPSGFSASASAQLLLEPTGGIVLFDDSTAHNDEVARSRPLGFTGSFFGTPVTVVDVSTNGNLNFSEDPDYFNVPMPDPSSVARINVLWDDLAILSGEGASIMELSDPGVYYSVTWSNIKAAGQSTGSQTFQVVWFGSNTTLQGFPFFPGDIALSYLGPVAAFADNFGDVGATIGLDRGDGTRTAPLPGTEFGLVTDDDRTLIPAASGRFVLFRPDDAGGYHTRIETRSQDVPEPSSFLLILPGVLAWVICVPLRHILVSPGRG